MLYSIFRAGDRKIKDMGHVKSYENHAERQMAVPNANMEIKNRILIGDKNIFENVKEYIKDIKLRKNNVIARDLLLTASPAFFEKASEQEKEKWVRLNTKWLRDNFGENCRYAALHKDEKTWHITALIVPRFFDEKRQKYILANARYFDGIAKMSAWQDNYAASIQTMFKDLNRGVKFSKAKHMQIRQFYTLVNAEINEADLRNICAKAKNSDLLEIKVKGLQRTLNSYRELSSRAAADQESMRAENSALIKSLKELESDKELYKEAVKALSEIHKIPQQSIKLVFDYVKGRANDKDNSPALELKK